MYAFISRFRLLFALFLFVTSNQTRAQIAEIQWGKAQPDESRMDVVQILGGDEKGYYLQKKSGINTVFAVIDQYDAQLNRVASKEILMKDLGNGDKKEFRNEGCYFLNNKIVLFSSWYDDSKEINFCYANVLEPNGFTLSPPILAAQIDAKDVPQRTHEKYGKFDIKLSKDQSKILIAETYPIDKQEHELFGLAVLDASLKLVWEKKIELPYKNKAINVGSCLIANNGTVLLRLDMEDLNKADQTRSMRNAEFMNHDYTTFEKNLTSFILLKDNGTRQITTDWIDLKPQGQRPLSRCETLDANNNIYCIGTYRKRDSQANMDLGTMYIKINGETGKIEKKMLQPFSKTEIPMAEDLGGITAYDFYMVKYLHLQPDGSCLAIMENDVAMDAQFEVANSKIPCYYDIVLIRFDPTGAIRKHSVIPKIQHPTLTIKYLSFIHNQQGETAYFLYNDNPKNFEMPAPKKSKIMDAPAKSIIVAAKIDVEGKVTREPFNPTDGLNHPLRIPVYHNLSDTACLVLGLFNDHYYLGKIVFK